MVCICDSIRRVDNRTGVWILQHPKERFHPIGTVRLARLGLRRVSVDTHFESFEDEAPIRRRLPAGTGVLFPSDRAIDLATLPASERPRDLLVLDGTWSQASSLARANPWIADLPHYRLDPGVSRYRIRKAPRAGYTSTIEAIVEALRILEPETEGLEALLEAFTVMIDRQIAHGDSSPRCRRRPRRLPRVIPRALLADRDSLVCVHAEFARDDSGRAELFHLAARRLGDGSIFERFVRPDRAMPSACRVEAMGGTLEDVTGGEERAAARAAWSAFLRPDDTLVAWRPTTFASMEPELERGASQVLLKAVCCNFARRNIGSLADALALHEEAVPYISGVAGRPGVVLSDLESMVEVLRAVKEASNAERVAIRR